MNGLCEQCQVYYPMPEDFGQGASYTCPTCNSPLAPFEVEQEATAEHDSSTEEDPTRAGAELASAVPAGEQATCEGAPADEHSRGEDVPSSDGQPGAADLQQDAAGESAGNEPEPVEDDSWGSMVGDAAPETPSKSPPQGSSEPPASEEASADDEVTPVRPAPAHETRPAEVHWFYPHPSSQVEAARKGKQSPPAEEAPGAEVPSAPSREDGREEFSQVEAPPPRPGEPDHREDRPPERRRSESSYVMKGAGSGQSKESLPLEVMAHTARGSEQQAEGGAKSDAPPEEPELAQPPPTRSMSAKVARPRSRGRGGLAAVASVALLLGGGGVWWMMGMPGVDVSEHDPAAAAPQDEHVEESVGEAGDQALPDDGEPDVADEPSEVADELPPETPSDETPSTPPRAASAEAERRPEPAEPAPETQDPPSTVEAEQQPDPGREVDDAPPPQPDPGPSPEAEPTETEVADARDESVEPSEDRSLPESKRRPPRVRKREDSQDAPPAPSEPDAEETRVAQATDGAEPEPEPAPEAEEPSPTDLAREHVRAGSRLVQQGRAQEAVTEFQKALEFDGRNAQAHRGLGVTYATLGRAADAARHYETYLELNPGASDADQVRQIVDAYHASQQ